MRACSDTVTEVHCGCRVRVSLRVSSEPRTKRLETEELQLRKRTMEGPAKPKEIDRSRSQPLQRLVYDKGSSSTQRAGKSQSKLSEEHLGSAQIAAAGKQHSHVAKRRGSLPVIHASTGPAISKPGASVHRSFSDNMKLPRPVPEDQRHASSGASKPGASQRQYFSDARPTSLPSGKVRVSGINSQLAAFCEEERARARARPLSSPSPKPILQAVPAGSVWLALSMLVSTVFACLARLFTALTFYTHTSESKTAGSTVDEHKTVAGPRRTHVKYAAGKSARAPRAHSTFEESRSVHPKTESEQKLAAPRSFARHTIHSSEDSLYTPSRTQPVQPKHHHNSTLGAAKMAEFV